MTTNLNHILIFKTNIRTKIQKQKLLGVLAAHSGIQQCTIDLSDVDRVLRIVSACLTHQQIISLIQQYGFDCAELT
jgi:hypothetical protein